MLTKRRQLSTLCVLPHTVVIPSEEGIQILGDYFLVPRIREEDDERLKKIGETRIFLGV
jgi:hypothetical protein